MFSTIYHLAPLLSSTYTDKRLVSRRPQKSNIDPVYVLLFSIWKLTAYQKARSVRDRPLPL